MGPLIVIVGGLAPQESQCFGGAAGPGLQIDLESIPDGSVAGYSGEQLVNAAYIINAGHALGLDRYDQTLGVATAMGESTLRVIDHGDAAGPDSRGLFQQRDNGAWGSYEDRMDPTISATNFFKVLMEVENRTERPPSLVIHEVQRNADPHHYTKFWEPANEVVAALADVDLPGVPEDYSASSGCHGLGPGGPPKLSDDCGPISHPRLHSSTCRAYAAIAEEFGNPWVSVGCYHPRPWENPPQDHPRGQACDYMVAPGGRLPDDEMDQTAITVVNWIIRYHEELDVKYVIYKGHIWNPNLDPVGIWDAVKRYLPSSNTGDITTDHYDHIHLSTGP